MTHARELGHDFIGRGELLQSWEQFCVCHTLEFKQSQILLFYPPVKCFSRLLLPVLFLSCIISAGRPFLGAGNSPDEAPTQPTLPESIPFLLGYIYNQSLESDSMVSLLRGGFIALDSFTSLHAVHSSYLIAGAQ